MKSSKPSQDGRPMLATNYPCPSSSVSPEPVLINDKNCQTNYDPNMQSHLPARKRSEMACQASSLNDVSKRSQAQNDRTSTPDVSLSGQSQESTYLTPESHTQGKTSQSSHASWESTSSAPLQPSTHRKEPNLSSTHDLNRVVRTYLNKITVENFPIMAEALCQVVEKVSTEDQIFLIVERVLDKAMSEPDFSEMYADLILIMSYRVPLSPDLSNQMKSTSACPKNEALFRLALIVAWKQQFERLQSVYANLLITSGNLSDEDHETELLKTKNQLKGGCYLFAELVNRRMIGLRGVNSELSSILASSNPPDYMLEGVCHMLSIAGSFLDTTSPGKHLVDNCFSRLGELSRGATVSKRIKFMIQEVQDARKVNWHKKLHTVKAKELAQIEQDITNAAYLGGLKNIAMYGRVVRLGERSNLQNNPHYAKYVEVQEKMHEARLKQHQLQPC